MKTFVFWPRVGHACPATHPCRGVQACADLHVCFFPRSLQSEPSSRLVLLCGDQLSAGNSGCHALHAPQARSQALRILHQPQADEPDISMFLSNGLALTLCFFFFIPSFAQRRDPHHQHLPGFSPTSARERDLCSHVPPEPGSGVQSGQWRSPVQHLCGPKPGPQAWPVYAPKLSYRTGSVIRADGCRLRLQEPLL